MCVRVRVCDSPLAVYFPSQKTGWLFLQDAVHSSVVFLGFDSSPIAFRLMQGKCAVCLVRGITINRRDCAR